MTGVPGGTTDPAPDWHIPPVTEADVTALETLQRDGLQVVQDFDSVYTLCRLEER